MLLRAFRRFLAICDKARFKSCGKNVVYDPLHSTFSYPTIEIGDSVYIGSGAYFRTTNSIIHIGSDVMFGPCVHIYGGNHIYNRVGTMMNKVKKSTCDVDADVVIEDEVWVGGCSIILSGVTIGRGSIIGAGSVVTKNVEPYSINAGNPSKKIKMRFNPKEIEMHERTILRKVS